MINDSARKYTDAELKRLENAIRREFGHAYQNLNRKWEEYLNEHTANGKPLHAAMQRAKDSGDSEALKKAKRKYQAYMREHTLKSSQYKRVRDSLAEALSNIDQAAVDLINGRLPGIYAVNYNLLAGSLPMGYAYGLITPQTIRNLVLQKLDFTEAVRWNKQLFNSEVLQGILHGDSVEKIAARFQKIFGANERAAIRDARTAVTGAENSGRLGSYYEAEKNGTVLVKVWSAAHDTHTRPTHLRNDGLQIPLDEPFPNGQMYPGDPTEPAEYYNCRCALGTHVVGFRRKDGSILYV